MGVQRLNDSLEQDLEPIALEHFTRLEVFIERLLPAGSAFLVALAFCLASLTFCYSFFHTFGFSCGRSGGVIISRGGFFTKIERRVLASRVTACRVRVTPAARLLHRSYLNIQQIITHMGNENTSYFYRLFHERYGQSPREYRRARSQRT